MKISVTAIALLACIVTPALAGQPDRWSLQVKEQVIAFRDTPSDRAACEARLPAWRALNDRQAQATGEKYSVDCVPVE